MWEIPVENSYRRSARHILLIAMANALVSVSGLILLPFLTKTLGAHAYGIWVQATVTIALAESLSIFGLPFALTRFLPTERERAMIQERFYSTLVFILFTSVAISALLFIFSAPIARGLFDGATEIVTIVALVVPVWCLDWVCLHYFRAFLQIGRYSVFILLKTYGEVGLIVWLVLAGHGIFGACLAVLIVRACLLGILLFLIASKIGIKMPTFSTLKEHLSFGLPTMPGTLSAWAVSSCDRYVIGYFLGATFVGFYSPGYTLGNFLIMMIIPSLSFVLVPSLSRLYDEGRLDEVKTHLKYALKYYLMVAIPFVFGATLLSRPLLVILSTPEIAAQGYLVTPVIACAVLLFGVYSVISLTLILAKKTRAIGATWIVAAALNLVLNILLVPAMGILGAAVSTLVAYALASGVIVYFSLRQLTFGIEWHSIAKSLAASAVMSAVVWLIAPAQTLTVVLAVVAGVVVYAAVLLMLKGFNREELAFFKGLLARA